MQEWDILRWTPQFPTGTAVGLESAAQDPKLDERLRLLRTAYTNPAPSAELWRFFGKALKWLENLVAGTGFEPVTFRL
jgi:hypothetical protein